MTLYIIRLVEKVCKNTRRADVNKSDSVIYLCVIWLYKRHDGDVRIFNLTDLHVI